MFRGLAVMRLSSDAGQDLQTSKLDMTLYVWLCPALSTNPRPKNPSPKSPTPNPDTPTTADPPSPQPITA